MSSKLLIRAFRAATKPSPVKVIGFSPLSSRVYPVNLLSRRQFSYTAPANNSPRTISEILGSEINTEQDDRFALDEQFQDYMTEQGYKAIDKPGNVITDLVKKNGSETIHVFVDTAAIIDTSSTFKSLQEQMRTDPEEFTDLDDDNIKELSVTEIKTVIEKNGRASVYDIHLSLLDFEISIASVTFFDHAEDAIKECNCVEEISSSAYSGPEFTNLDEELQDAILKYLKDKGLGDEHWELIIAYSGVKENNDYINWLQNFKQFVDAK